MNIPDGGANESIPKISEEDLKMILKHYNANQNVDEKVSFTKDEIHKLADDFKANKLKDPSLIKIIEKFDTNKDGILDDKEKAAMEDHLNSTLRYAGYSAVFARAFRYLAFTSGKIHRIF